MSSILSSICLLFNCVLSLAANLKDSAGVNVSKRTSSCCTKAPNFPKSLAFIVLSLHLSSPSNLDPGESPSLWPSTLRNEVLPLPDAPMIAMTSPGLANPLRLCNIFLVLCVEFSFASMADLYLLPGGPVNLDANV